jgi:hypothetical protein
MIGLRPLRVQHLKETQKFPDCQILFIGAVGKDAHRYGSCRAAGNSGAYRRRLRTFRKSRRSNRVLPGRKKIRFEINLDAATEAKLKISAKLLSLAKTVVGDPRAN